MRDLIKQVLKEVTSVPSKRRRMLDILISNLFNVEAEIKWETQSSGDLIRETLKPYVIMLYTLDKSSWFPGTNIMVFYRTEQHRDIEDDLSLTDIDKLHEMWIEEKDDVMNILALERPVFVKTPMAYYPQVGELRNRVIFQEGQCVSGDLDGLMEYMFGEFN